MDTQFKYGLIGDTHSEVTIMPLEDLDSAAPIFLLKQGCLLMYSLCSTLPLPTRGTILQSYIYF